MRLSQPPTRPSTQSGLTLLEVLLAVSLLGILAYKGFAVLDSAADTTQASTSEVLVEERCQIVLERIARAVMSSSRESLAPAAEAPLSTEELTFQMHLGIENGEVIWSDPEKIALEQLENEAYWTRTPEAGPEQRVVLTHLVRPYLEGELPNGMDDNGNGLIDEKGLSFVVDRNAVHIRITLERVDGNGRLVTRTAQTTVTCRNPVPEVVP
ncbi:MAG: prepilin-type N-terminal cleavage/methylation domain-containing protein [Planctomycetes bacterium]|nr:prepilin-type N-terminal cleavage/methylation domain-containing protein [Planctomycetota bacterium]